MVRCVLTEAMDGDGGGSWHGDWCWLDVEIVSSSPASTALFTRPAPNEDDMVSGRWAIITSPCKHTTQLQHKIQLHNESNSMGGVYRHQEGYPIEY